MADKFDELMKELRLLKREMELKRLREVEDRTIFIKIHFDFYPISCEILGQMFSGVVVESIDRFRDGDQFHSRIRFPNRDLAVEAFKWFNGRCIYHGCCQLDLFLESTLRAHSSSNGANTDILGTSTTNFGVLEQSNSNFGVQEQSNCNLAHLGEGVVEEIAAPNQQLADDSSGVPQSSNETKKHDPNLATLNSKMQESCLNLQDSYKSMQENGRNMIDLMEQMRGGFREMADELRQWREEIEAKASVKELSQETDSSPQSNHPSSEIEEDEQELQTQIDSSKVISVYPSFAKINVELVKTTELGKHCIASVKSVGESVEDWTDIRTDFRKRSVEFLEFSSAHKLFVKMTRHGESSIAIAKDIVKDKGVLILVFDPGGVFALALIEEEKSEIAIDDWSHYLAVFSKLEGVFGHQFGSTRQDSILLPYDRRKVVSLPCCWDEEINCGVTIFKLCDVLILVFDPGISE